MIKAGVIGGTGYTGVELLRLLGGHPEATPCLITSRAKSGTQVAELFPSLRGFVDLAFCDPGAADFSECDVVFSATPNGIAMQHAPGLLAQGIRLVDLSADFRLKDPAEWSHWYGMDHACPELISEAVYGLPEINRDSIRSARLVANPGCYPTAVQLGFLPLVEQGLADTTSLIADAKSGASGAGRNAAIGTLLCEAGDSLKAYGVPGHRHLPEIRQGLALAAGAPVALTFVPHLAPMIRGIHATLYVRLIDPTVDLTALFEERYRGEPFIDVMPAGSHPDTRSVRGSNYLRIACHQPQGGEMAVILVVEDNLVKGAAGQAVQNMNLMFGLAETTGLKAPALTP
ncbi:MAG: N-acetyl-gamma-glutamyl-phosphate reductase [Arenicellales bacterium]|jgi:N-acetyl-gamma-glutamyl-phosphate reductase|nr:N-acetyl-gamma-glutamyl-phosphate reductase [Arenicellales bacterium]|tara:strand:+ start:643 stop:1674 length:1032 start_codon:yes stop_codon:yes gene_type:complete